MGSVEQIIFYLFNYYYFCRGGGVMGAYTCVNVYFVLFFKEKVYILLLFLPRNKRAFSSGLGIVGLLA